MLLAGGDETADHADQPCVEHGGYRALRAAETRREFVRAGDGAACDAVDDGPGGKLVGGVAGGEARGHGEGRDLRRDGRHFGLEPGEVEGRCLGARMMMPAGQRDHRIARQRLGQARPLQIARTEAYEDQRDAPSLALDQRVGGKRGRERDEPHVLRRDLRFGQGRIDGPADPECKIRARGQGLGPAHHALRLGIDDHRIGVGASGIDPEKKRHGSLRDKLSRF